jgi:hypothetical protein
LGLKKAANIMSAAILENVLVSEAPRRASQLPALEQQRYRLCRYSDCTETSLQSQYQLENIFNLKK